MCGIQGGALQALQPLARSLGFLALRQERGQDHMERSGGALSGANGDAAVLPAGVGSASPEPSLLTIPAS